MLHNIVFTDNIFILSRMLSVISQSIQLDLAEDLFCKKIYDDISFCFETIKRLLHKLQNQEHLHDYVESMKCLYLCNTRFLEITATIESSEKDFFAQNKETISALKHASEQIKSDIAKKIHNTNADAEITTIVSEIELNELLNFQGETVPVK